LLGQNSRAAGLFNIRMRGNEPGAAPIEWTKVERWRTWSQLSEGAYVLRTNVRDWSEHQQILLQQLGLSLTSHLRKTDL